MSSNNFLGGLLVGAGIGVLAGILLAPAKGNDTLKKVSDGIRDKFNQFKGDAKDMADNVANEGKNLMDKGNNAAKDYLQDVKKN